MVYPRKSNNSSGRRQSRVLVSLTVSLSPSVSHGWSYDSRSPSIDMNSDLFHSTVNSLLGDARHRVLVVEDNAE